MNLPVVQARLAAADVARIERAAAYVETHDTDKVLAELLPALTSAERADVSRHLVFDHTAVLVFPDSSTASARNSAASASNRAR